MRGATKRSRLISPVFLGTGLAIGLVASSGAAAKTAETATKASLVTVDGIGLVKGKPDTIALTMGVETSAATVREALDAANDRTNKLISVLKEAGVAEDDLATANFSIWPRYSENGAQVTGYQVSNMVSATLRDLGSAGTTIDRAAREVGDQVRMHGVSFDIEDDTALLAAARQSAVKNARDKADQLGKGASLKVVRVKSITETTPMESNEFSRYRDMSVADAASSVPLSSGTQSRSVTVRVVYELG